MRDPPAALRKKILFICGSINQTTQLVEVAQHLGQYEHWFTPSYTDRMLALWRKLGFLNMSIWGNRLRARCLAYLESHDLPLDLDGKTVGNSYDLVVTCTDQIYPRNMRDKKVVVVQDGMLDRINFFFRLNRLLPWLVPRWVAGTAATGQSKMYQKLCVASPGYRDYFIRHGIPPEKIAVTGIPRFDDCERYRDNDFGQRGYCLVCTSDGRQTHGRDSRKKLIRFANRIADGRPIIFKLHPNERIERAVREIRRGSPAAQICSDGHAEEMVANCEVLVCEDSSLAYVGLALGKQVHSYFDLAELRRLMPLQNRSAARNIAAVCREILGDALPARPALRLVQGDGHGTARLVHSRMR